MNRRMFFQAVPLRIRAARACRPCCGGARPRPPSGVTPTVLARGTYDSFKVRSYPQGPGDFKAEAKAPTDIVVRRHVYAAGVVHWLAHASRPGVHHGRRG